jgi:nitrate/nitrite-specific signal transduction histidine kinase
MRTELGTHVLFDALLEACKRVKRRQYNHCVKDGGPRDELRRLASRMGISGYRARELLKTPALS